MRYWNGFDFPATVWYVYFKGLNFICTHPDNCLKQILERFSLLTRNSFIIGNDLDPYTNWKNRIPVDLIWSPVVPKYLQAEVVVFLNTDNAVIFFFHMERRPYHSQIRRVRQVSIGLHLYPNLFAVAPMPILTCIRRVFLSSAWCCYPVKLYQ